MTGRCGNNGEGAFLSVTPAEAGVQNLRKPWIPAFAGMTILSWIPAFAGMTGALFFLSPLPFFLSPPPFPLSPPRKRGSRVCFRGKLKSFKILDSRFRGNDGGVLFFLSPPRKRGSRVCFRGKSQSRKVSKFKEIQNTKLKI